MSDESYRFPYPLPRSPDDGANGSDDRRRWDRIVDFLGGCRPLNLIVSACAIIEVVAIAARIISG